MGRMIQIGGARGALLARRADALRDWEPVAPSARGSTGVTGIRRCVRPASARRFIEELTGRKRTRGSRPRLPLMGTERKGKRV